MDNENPTSDTAAEDDAAADATLDAPSDETDDEPKAAKPHDPEPDHEAIGVGVIDDAEAAIEAGE